MCHKHFRDKPAFLLGYRGVRLDLTWDKPACRRAGPRPREWPLLPFAQATGSPVLREEGRNGPSLHSSQLALENPLRAAPLVSLSATEGAKGKTNFKKENYFISACARCHLVR